jgi:type IV pilus assembly protein PilX
MTRVEQLMNSKRFKSVLCSADHHRQRGVVLFVSLIMLLVMTLIGVTGMQNSSMEEKMVANVRDIDLSFQAAEAALREAETSLQVAVLKEFDGSNTGLYQPATRDSQPLWEVGSTWNAGGALPYTGSLAYLSAQPQYIIEELPPVPDPEGSVAADEPLPETRVYRVTARGVGGTAKAITILQAAFKR